MDKRNLGVGGDTGIKPHDPDTGSSPVLTTTLFFASYNKYFTYTSCLLNNLFLWIKINEILFAH